MNSLGSNTRRFTSREVCGSYGFVSFPFEIDGAWHIRGEVLTPDGQTRWSASANALISTPLDELEALGRNLAKTVRDQAGGDLPVFTD